MPMKRQITLLSALLAGSAFAQTDVTSAPETKTTTTTIGEVTLTRPVAPSAQAVPSAQADATQATPHEKPAAQAPAAPSEPSNQAATSSTATAPAGDTPAALPQETPTQPTPHQPDKVQPAQAQPAQQPKPASSKVGGVEIVPAQPVQPVSLPPAPAAAPVSAPSGKAAPAVRPNSAPQSVTPKPVQTEKTQPGKAQTEKAQTEKGQQGAKAAAPKASAPISTQSSAVPTEAPSDLPSGWRHISGSVAGAYAKTLPAGSRVQVAIEAINRATGRHTPHLVVNFAAAELPADYFINYNPGRMNTAENDYVIQAKVFAAGGDMLYMSDTRQPLPSDVAAKLKIDMSF